MRGIWGSSQKKNQLFSKKLLKKVRYQNMLGKIVNPINRDFSLKVGEKPFKHFVIDDFLAPHVHQELKYECKNIPCDEADAYKGLFEAPVKGPLYVHYVGDWHDIYRLNINPHHALQMNLFYQRDFADFIQSFFPELMFTNQVLCELHHHEAFARDGFVHSDYDPAKFTNSRVYDGMDTSWEAAGAEACDPSRRTPGHYVQRCVAFAYYLGLGPKIEEEKPMGGHTAFFSADNHIKPAGGIAPIENRFMMFEITPISFHASRKNNSLYRDALFGWYHTEMINAKCRHPTEDLCHNVKIATDPTKDASYGYEVEE